MSGMAMIIMGVVILILATAGAGAAQCLLREKKRRMREEIYHIWK